MNSTSKKRAKSGSPSAAPKGPGISRRDFLKGAAVAAGASALAACAPAVAPTGAPQNRKWDKETDVVVVGTGTVSVAALAAADNGAKVLILEKAPVFGGHTAISGGWLWVPNNHVMQAQGIADSREEALAYVRRCARDRFVNDALITTYVDTAPVMIQWLDSIGIGPWEIAGGAIAYQDYQPSSYPGYKKTGRPIAIKGHSSGSDGGKALIDLIKKQIDAPASNIEVLLETPAKRLIYDGDSSAGTGQVIGIVAQTAGGQEIFIKARKAVILGTGGFEHNKEMCEHFLYNPIYYTCSVPTNTGDGHLMAMAVGAQLRNMNSVWGTAGYDVKEGMTGVMEGGTARGKPGAIVVNKHGERIGNESAAYAVFEHAFAQWDTGLVEWRNIPSFTLFDSGYTSRYALPGAAKVGDVPDFVKQADTLEDLATQLGINTDRLAETISRFNENASNGVDPDYHRGENTFDKQSTGDSTRTDLKNVCLAPLETAPYYGAPIWPGALGTNGGPVLNENGQALNVWGDLISRLYVTSNLSSGNVTGGVYLGGGSTIGPGMTFAYIGGKQAAALQSWEQG